MGRLKELLAEANLDFDTITASKAEAHRLLHQASKANLDAALAKNQQHVQQPA